MVIVTAPRQRPFVNSNFSPRLQSLKLRSHGLQSAPVNLKSWKPTREKNLNFAKIRSLNCAPEFYWLDLLTCKSHRKRSKYAIFILKCGICGDSFALERFWVCIRDLSKIQHRNSLAVDLYLEQSRFKWRISYHLFALWLALWRVLKLLAETEMDKDLVITTRENREAFIILYMKRTLSYSSLFS